MSTKSHPFRYTDGNFTKVIFNIKMIIMNISGPQILVVNGFTLAVTGLGDQQTHADFTLTWFNLACTTVHSKGKDNPNNTYQKLIISQGDPYV